MTAITSHRPQWSGRRQPRGETPATWPSWPLADFVLISKLGARASFLNSMTEPSVRLVAALEKRRGFIYRCCGRLFDMSEAYDPTPSMSHHYTRRTRDHRWLIGTSKVPNPTLHDCLLDKKARALSSTGLLRFKSGSVLLFHTATV